MKSQTENLEGCCQNQNNKMWDSATQMKYNLLQLVIKGSDGDSKVVLGEPVSYEHE